MSRPIQPSRATSVRSSPLSPSLLRSTAIVGAMTLLSRVLGFLRDIILARAFGADGTTDAFFLAFKIPNFLRRLFAEGAFSQAFVPVFTEYKEKRDQEQLRDLIDHVTGTLGGILLAVTLLGIIAAPALVMLFGPGFADEPQRFTLAEDMLRLTFPYLLFVSLTALSAGVLNSYDRFALPAFTPVVLNLCLITAALWLAPKMAVPVEALAWGVLAAGALQLLIQLPGLARLRLLPRPRWGWRHSGVRRVIKLMIPALFGSSVAQINLLLDTVIASFLVAGSISWLYYSDRLVELPLGLLAIALSTVILPHLSRHHSQAAQQDFHATLDWALRWVILVGLPATLGLLLLAGPILATLFYGERFDQHDLDMARMSLMAYTLGLPAFMLVKVLAPGYYARQDTRTPVRIGIIAMVANMVLNLLYVLPWVWSDTPGAHTGLALATATSSWINAALLYRGLRHQGHLEHQAGWGRFILRLLAAGGAMLALLLALTPPLEHWLAADTLQRAGWLLGLIGAGAAVYFALLAATGLRPRHLRSP